MNPGPKPNHCHSFSIWHWNLNSLNAHNYLKASLLRAYVAIRKFDVVCLSETYLHSSNLSDDDNFNLPSYNVVRENFHHQTLFARFNLKVVFPPSYEREIWHFNKANVDHIGKAINDFQWEKSFQNI